MRITLHVQDEIDRTAHTALNSLLVSLCASCPYFALGVPVFAICSMHVDMYLIIIEKISENLSYNLFQGIL